MNFSHTWMFSMPGISVNFDYAGPTLQYFRCKKATTPECWLLVPLEPMPECFKCQKVTTINNQHSDIVSFFSLHIHSMWETICDAVASWSGWKFGSKIPVYPILGFGPQFPPPPKKKNSNLGRSWHLEYFEFWLPRIPPPLQFKIRQILALRVFWVLTSQNTPKFDIGPGHM